MFLLKLITQAIVVKLIALLFGLFLSLQASGQANALDLQKRLKIKTSSLEFPASQDVCCCLFRVVRSVEFL